MKHVVPNLATDENRWLALVFVALGLAIVIIDNNVLNVAIPYIIRELRTNFAAIQWVISGYPLLIATLLITMGRLGDMFGRKKIFLLGTGLFAVGSFIASVSGSVFMLFAGEAFIEAIGASMMLTSALAILAYEFRGKERAMAFGIWGAIAGASASVGPLLGGYLTAYFSWRWSFRINVVIALITILGSVFIKESRSHDVKRFDWVGTLLSGIGLFCLVFSFIEGRTYGWLFQNAPFSFAGMTWSFGTLSPIPFMIVIAVVSLLLFIRWELHLERQGRSPVLRLSMFLRPGFSFGLLTLAIVSLGQFGIFFTLPLILENVLGLNAFMTGVAFLPASLSVFLFGPISGMLATKINPKWLVNIGMFVYALGTIVLILSLSTTSTALTLAPAFILYGMGIGIASSQLTNIIISSVPLDIAGEASASSATMRQIGSTLSGALIGTIFAGTLITSLTAGIAADRRIPGDAKPAVIRTLGTISPEGRQFATAFADTDPALSRILKADSDQAFVTASRTALSVASVFVLAGACVSLLIPRLAIEANPWEKKTPSEDGMAGAEKGSKNEV